MAAYAAIFGESVKGLKAESYLSNPVTDEAWADIQKAFALMNAEPDNAELKANAMKIYKESCGYVMDRNKTFYALDADKAATLQELVDKYALK